MAERSALFVRLPADLATRLDAHIGSVGRSKQAVVTDLLTAQLGAEGQAHTASRDPGELAGVETETIGSVVDLEQVANLLKVSTTDVMARIADGDFPARRFGDSWRFSRPAVLAWLAGTDPIHDRETGFARPIGNPDGDGTHR